MDVRGQAVLLHTGDDIRFGTPGYADGAHFLTGAGAEWLAAQDAALVGIDAINIDDTGDAARPAHTRAARGRHPGRRAPDRAGSAAPGRRPFTAVPLRVAGLGTIPVRAFAQLPA